MSADRFWARVDKNGPVHPVYGVCWLWIGPPNTRGYGQFMVAGKTLRAHRYSYELNCGEVPKGAGVLHKCDVRLCVNPSHLFVGDNAVNQADKVAKGRQARGEGNAAAELSDDQIREIRRRYRLKRNYHDPVNGQNALAREFRTSQANISLIVRGEAWKHVT